MSGKVQEYVAKSNIKLGRTIGRRCSLETRTARLIIKGTSDGRSRSEIERACRRGVRIIAWIWISRSPHGVEVVAGECSKIRRPPCLYRVMRMGDLRAEGMRCVEDGRDGGKRRR